MTKKEKTERFESAVANEIERLNTIEMDLTHIVRKEADKQLKYFLMGLISTLANCRKCLENELNIFDRK